MRKVLSSQEMRRVDAETGIDSSQLMENAATAVVREISSVAGDVSGKKMLVVCGKGNNGGDGAAVARLLVGGGARVRAVLLGLVADTSGDARANFERLLDMAGDSLMFSELATDEEVSEFIRAEGTGPAYDFVVDAIFGTGLTRPLEGMHARVAEWICGSRSEQSGPAVVAVDVPSGLDADSGSPIGPHVQADLTVTFTSPKAANVLPPASSSCGRLVIADIGSPAALVDGCASQLYLAERRDIHRWLRATEFTDASYKGKRGHVLIVAGSGEYSGAAALAANAAMMSGVGMVTLATPKSARDAVTARLLPEIIVRALDECADGIMGDSAVPAIENLIASGIDAVEVGSGLTSQHSETRALVRALVARRAAPIVIDADGLNALSPMEPVLSGPPVVLTPHAGEFLRLVGREPGGVIEDRVGEARRFSKETGVILVLKGAPNLVASPDGSVVIVPTGNPGVGKAGGGDTLAGIITGFIAQGGCFGQDPFDSVIAAVYVAGVAGDIAEQKFGKRVMLASDVRDCLAEAFLSV